MDDKCLNRFSLATKTPFPFAFQTPAKQAKARLISNAVIEQAIYKFPSRFCLLNKSIRT